MSNTEKIQKIEPRLLKGFRDYGPTEQLARQQMFTKIQSVFERFGFLPLSTPVLEYKDILMGKYGDDEKLVYSFKDNGDRDVAMRYDLTVPLARYVAQNQGQLTFPFKRYQIAPVWRADNPQKGRLREFYQCDVDAVGTDSLLADAEAIACVCRAYDEIGVENYVLRINDRRMFDLFLRANKNNQELTNATIRSLDKVDKIGVDGVISDLQEKQLSEEIQELSRKWLTAGRGVDTLQKMPEIFGDDVKIATDSLLTLYKYLSQLGVNADKILFDPTIARGADYYTGVIFEWYLEDNWQFGSIGSGGRYDNLVDQFSNQSLPAVGASIGVDRLFEYLEDKNSLEFTSGVRALLLNQNDSLLSNYLKLAADLRAQNINVELYYTAAKLDKQFKYAESKGIPFAIIMGETEAKDGTVQLKDLAKREQVTITAAELPEKLQ